MAENFCCWVALCCFSDIQCMWSWTHNNQITYHYILQTIQDLSFYGPHITPRAVGEPSHHHCFIHSTIYSLRRVVGDGQQVSRNEWDMYKYIKSKQIARTSESRPWRILGTKSNKSITQWINHSNTKNSRDVFILYSDSAYKIVCNVYVLSRKWLYKKRKYIIWLISFMMPIYAVVSN